MVPSVGHGWGDAQGGRGVGSLELKEQEPTV